MRLIAHELTHVIQQGAAGRAAATEAGIIQRKVVVGGTPLPPVGSRSFKAFGGRVGHGSLALVHAGQHVGSVGEVVLGAQASTHRPL